jgi:UDP-glucose 4-epimerase
MELGGGLSVILVLGGDGFIGKRFSLSAAALGMNILSLDRFARPSNPADTEHLRRTKVDAMDVNSLREHFHGATVVVDCLPDSNPSNSISLSEANLKIMASRKKELIDAVMQSDTGLYVFLSSGGTVYGETSLTGAGELDERKPSSAYGRYKVEIEDYLLAKYGDGGRVLILRLSTLYGLRSGGLSSQGLVHNSLISTVNRKPLTVYGDGTMIRDYLEVGDAVKIILQLIQTPQPFQVFNVGSGAPLSVNEILAAVRAVTGLPLNVVYEKIPQGFVTCSVLKISRLVGAVPNLAFTSLRQGLEYHHSQLMNNRGQD